MNCDCITLVDKELEPKGFRLSTKLFMFRVSEETLDMRMVMVVPLERLDGGRLKRNDQPFAWIAVADRLPEDERAVETKTEDAQIGTWCLIQRRYFEGAWHVVDERHA